jgi:uncharacterized membrane protein YphA (DoxX/SURF4 family)
MAKIGKNEVGRPLGPRRCDREGLLSLAYHLVRVGLGGVFVYAGVIKLLDPRGFARALAQFGLLPEPLLPLVAVGLPALELLAGAGLVFEVRGCLGAVAALLGVFLLVLGYAILLDMDVDCGCFTVDELSARTSVKYAFFRDLALAAAVIFLFRRRSGVRQRRASANLQAN